MFIGGLNPQTTESSLRQYFTQFGDIQDLVIMRDKDQNTSRGFGFITFFNNQVLMGVLRSQPHFVDGKQVDCKPAVPKDQQQSSIQMLFSGLQRGLNVQQNSMGYLQQHNGINQQQQYQQQFNNSNYYNQQQQQYPQFNNYGQNNTANSQYTRQNSNSSIKSVYQYNQNPQQSPPLYNQANNYSQQQYPFPQMPFNQPPNFNNFGNQYPPQQQVPQLQPPNLNNQQQYNNFNLSNHNQAQQQQQIPAITPLQQQQQPLPQPLQQTKKSKSNLRANTNANTNSGVQQNGTKSQQQKLKQQTQEYQKQIQKQTILIKEQEIHINRLQAKYQQQQQQIITKVKTDNDAQEHDGIEVPAIQPREGSSSSISDQNDQKDNQSDQQVNTESTNAQLSPIFQMKDKVVQEQDPLQLSISSKISEHSNESSINYTQSKIQEQTMMIKNQLSLTQISESQYRKIFVGGLPHNLSDEEFRQFFSQYGEIEDCAILKDKRTGKPRGFGFVTYYSVDQADYVMSIKDKHFIQDKWVDCKRAVPASLLKEDSMVDTEKSHSKIEDISKMVNQNSSFSPNPKEKNFNVYSGNPSRRVSNQIPRNITPLQSSNISLEITEMINQQMKQQQQQPLNFPPPPNMNYQIQHLTFQQYAQQQQQQQQMQQFNFMQNKPQFGPQVSYPLMNNNMPISPIPPSQFHPQKQHQMSQFHQQAYGNQMNQNPMGYMEQQQQNPYMLQQQQQVQPFIPPQNSSPIPILNQQNVPNFQPNTFHPTPPVFSQHQRQNSNAYQSVQEQMHLPIANNQSIESQNIQQLAETKSGHISLVQSPTHSQNKRQLPTQTMSQANTGLQQQQQNQQRPQLQVQTNNLVTPTPSESVPLMSDEPPSPIEKSKPTPQPPAQTFQNAIQGFPAFQYLNGQLATPQGGAQSGQSQNEFKSGFPYSQAFRQHLQNNQQLQDQLNNTSFSLGFGYGNLNQSLNISLDSVGKKQQEQTEWFIQSLQNQFEQSFTDDAMMAMQEQNENQIKMKKDTTIQNINDQIKRNQQKDMKEEGKIQNDEIMIKVDWKQIDSNTNLGGFFTQHVQEKPQQQQSKAADKQDLLTQQQEQSQYQHQQDNNDTQVQKVSNDTNKSVTSTGNVSDLQKGTNQNFSNSNISVNVSQVSTQPQEKFKKEQASITQSRIQEEDITSQIETQVISQFRTSTNLHGLVNTQQQEQPRRYVFGNGQNFQFGKDRPSSKTAIESHPLNSSRVEFGQIKSEQKKGPSREDRQFKPY